MIDFPCAKINLGLNIVSKRTDGYHNLQTVFMPIPLTDALEIKTMDDRFPSETACDLKVTGDALCCNETDNLVIKAYNIIAADFNIPRVHAHLHKIIPSQAGLGGGSSDAAFMIRLLDKRFRMNIGNAEMEKYAARIGADCPFFITAEPSYAEGIGEVLMPVNVWGDNLKDYKIIVIKPNVAVSTKEAFSLINPTMPATCCRDIVSQPICKWRDLGLSNDFEKSVFAIHPQLKEIKDTLYACGALYAQMSGSGSCLFGIFEKHTDMLPTQEKFSEHKVYVMTF